MYYWKLDEETIRCLINKNEIKTIGFDVQQLLNDNDQMHSFLDAIVKNSENYFDWHTENGVQNYVARSLPADQYLITISCTLQDEAIDRDLDQIKRMTSALNAKITDDRISEIYALSGEEKEKAFESLSKDLHNVCMGKIDDESLDEGATQQQKTGRADEKMIDTDEADQKQSSPSGITLPVRQLSFREFSGLLSFCALLDKRMFLPSTLYKDQEEYILLVDLSHCEDDAQAVAFMITAEEYGAVGSALRYEDAYLSEHARLMIENDAIRVLCSMAA